MDSDLTIMSVRAIDFVKSYYQRGIKILTLVQVIDQNNDPVENARVQIQFKQRVGYSTSKTGYTDQNGVTIFDIGTTDPSRWEVGVRDVQHPCYSIDSASLMIRSRYTHV
ncbi:MAG: hypothetical protein ACFFF4_02285 [Candidatus Thorarchaeota archaeon]